MKTLLVRIGYQDIILPMSEEALRVVAQMTQVSSIYVTGEGYVYYPASGEIEIKLSDSVRSFLTLEEAKEYEKSVEEAKEFKAWKEQQENNDAEC